MRQIMLHSAFRIPHSALRRLLALVVAEAFLCSTILPAWAFPTDFLRPKSTTQTSQGSLRDALGRALDGGKKVRGRNDWLAEEHGVAIVQLILYLGDLVRKRAGDLSSLIAERRTKSPSFFNEFLKYIRVELDPRIKAASLELGLDEFKVIGEEVLFDKQYGRVLAVPFEINGKRFVYFTKPDRITMKPHLEKEIEKIFADSLEWEFPGHTTRIFLPEGFRKSEVLSPSLVKVRDFNSHLWSIVSVKSWVKRENLFVRQIAHEIPVEARLLSLGAGDGRDEVYLARRGYDVTALDISTRAMQRLKKIAIREGLQDRLHTAVHDMAKPFKRFSDGSFDIIYSHSSLQYFTQAELRDIAGELHRLLSPGGLIFILAASTSDPRYQTGLRVNGDLFINHDGIARHFLSEKKVLKVFQEFEILRLSQEMRDPYKGLAASYGQRSAYFNLKLQKGHAQQTRDGGNLRFEAPSRLLTMPSFYP